MPRSSAHRLTLTSEDRRRGRWTRRPKTAQALALRADRARGGGPSNDYRSRVWDQHTRSASGAAGSSRPV